MNFETIPIRLRKKNTVQDLGHYIFKIEWFFIINSNLNIPKANASSIN